MDYEVGLKEVIYGMWKVFCNGEQYIIQLNT